MMFWSEYWLGGGSVTYLTGGPDIDIVVEDMTVDAGSGTDVLVCMDETLTVDETVDVVISEPDEVDVE